MYFFQLVDHYAASITIMFLAFLQIIGKFEISLQILSEFTILFRSNILVLRCESINQEHQADDLPAALDLLPVLLVYCCTSIALCKYIF